MKISVTKEKTENKQRTKAKNKSKKDCFMYNFYAWSNVFYFYTME